MKGARLNSARRDALRHMLIDGARPKALSLMTRTPMRHVKLAGIVRPARDLCLPDTGIDLLPSSPRAPVGAGAPAGHCPEAAAQTFQSGTAASGKSLQQSIEDAAKQKTLGPSGPDMRRKSLRDDTDARRQSPAVRQ